jgi:AcrR family transcriptional regulator
MDHMGLRQRKKLRTRRAIADAALRLFDERGYEETTISDIAAAADVSPRTFFSYFPSKDDVVFAEMDERLADVRARLAERPGGETPLATFRRVAEALVRAIASEEGEYGAIPVALIRERPSLQAQALKRLSDAEDGFVTVLREIAPELDDVTAVTVIGVAFGGLRAAITYCRAQGFGPARTREAAERALAIVERVLESVPAITCRPANAEGTAGSPPPSCRRPT